MVLMVSSADPLLPTLGFLCRLFGPGNRLCVVLFICQDRAETVQDCTFQIFRDS